MNTSPHLGPRDPNSEVSVKQTYWRIAREVKDWASWPAIAFAELRYERSGLSADDPGSERVLVELIEWLGQE